MSIPQKYLTSPRMAVRSLPEQTTASLDATYPSMNLSYILFSSADLRRGVRQVDR